MWEASGAAGEASLRFVDFYCLESVIAVSRAPDPLGLQENFCNRQSSSLTLGIDLHWSTKVKKDEAKG